MRVMNLDAPVSRRNFLFQMIAGTLLFVASRPPRVYAQAELKLIQESVPLAKGLKFTQDAATSTFRKNVKATCANCKMWLTKGSEGKMVDGIPVAKCQMFLGQGYAKGTGWCTSWVINPKAPAVG